MEVFTSWGSPFLPMKQVGTLNENGEEIDT